MRRYLLGPAVGLVAVLSGCGGDSEPEAAPTAASDDYAGLCTSIATAESGTLEQVTAVFDHGPLHALAEETLEADRALGARLLEAKEAVESALTDPSTTPASLKAKLTALADLTREAQRTTGEPELAPCSKDNP